MDRFNGNDTSKNGILAIGMLGHEKNIEHFRYSQVFEKYSNVLQLIRFLVALNFQIDLANI